MFAIEFQAKVKNGRIEIPAEYQARFSGPVRVILLAEEPPSQGDLIDRLLAQPLKVEGFRPLTREEIYERG